MRRAGWISLIARAPLCAALAFAFLIMTVVQPGVHAMAESAGMIMPSAASVSVHGDHAMAASHDASMHKKNSHHQSGGENSIDKGCEVQCAPVSVTLANCLDLEHVMARCYAPSSYAVLEDGEPANLIRPPRPLI